jgi:hypothetical protein
MIQEKRYRSMQEHIRRAHPEYYIPKLPATKESFEQMITTAPHEVPPPENNRPHSSHVPQQNHHHTQHAHPSGLSSLALNSDNPFGSSFEGGYNPLGGHDGGYYTASDTEAAMYNGMQLHQPRSPYDEYRRGSIIGTQTAAAVLAGLHSSRADSEFEGDFAGQVIFPSLQMSPTVTEADLLQSYHADNEFKPNHFSVDPALDEQDYLQDHNFPPAPESDSHGLPLTEFVRSSSPNGRPSTMATMPSLHRSLSRGGGYANRPRKSSLSQQGRMPKHERKKSKDLKRRSGEKFADHRWLDLVEAAASATEEEGSRDLTPVSQGPRKMTTRSNALAIVSDKENRCRDLHINRQTSQTERLCLHLRWARSSTLHFRHRRLIAHSHLHLQNKMPSICSRSLPSTAVLAPTSLTTITTSRPTAALSSKSCILRASIRRHRHYSRQPAEESKVAEASITQHHIYTATAVQNPSS